MYYFSEGELFGEIIELRKNQARHCWFWYRDVLEQAKERGYLKILSISNPDPMHRGYESFWRLKFDDNIEIISDKLKKMIEEGDKNE